MWTAALVVMAAGAAACVARRLSQHSAWMHARRLRARLEPRLSNGSTPNLERHLAVSSPSGISS
jgi:hypothetical protein